MKVMRIGCHADLINMQCAAIRLLEGKNLCTPEIIPTNSGADFASINDEKGNLRLVWVIKAKSGVCYSGVEPRSEDFINDLGSKIGEIDNALKQFDHPYLDRDFKWNLMKSDWISDHLDLISDNKRKDIIISIIEEYQSILHEARKLPHFAIHNDLNDYNILVTSDDHDGVLVSGIIDFGDMVRSPHVCELAIACAYIVLDQANPIKIIANLVAAYHKKNQLKEKDTENFKDNLKIINNQIKQIEKLVNEFSDFARMPKPILKDNDLNKLIAENIKLLSEIDRSIKIEFFESTTKILLKSDKEQLSRVFFNLIKNSIESINQKSEKNADFNKKIVVEISENNNHIQFVLVDNGVGFDIFGDKIKDILNPYYTTKKNGTGLGLSIVNKIINDHNGFIKFIPIKDGAKIEITFLK